jgi:hypothetical protein
MSELPIAAQRCSRRPVRAWLLAIALAAQVSTATAAFVRVAWISDHEDDSILVTTGLLAFHDGSLDFFDHDRPPPALLARSIPPLQSFGEYSLQEALLRDYPLAEFRAFLSEPHPGIGGVIDPPRPRWPLADQVVLELIPGQHDYLSFLLPIQPSNDAFAGNEEPQRHRLFDDDGRFLGPFYIDVYGAEAFDAGLCDNNETGLAWLDRPVTGGVQACDDGEAQVRQHPGLNGSLRNPGGVPMRVLGATSGYSSVVRHHFDRVAADFTRPGKRLGRLLVSTDTSWFGASGSWYSPERAGEGFSLQVMPPDPLGGQSRALVYWYTYAPDGSGRQVWLTGVGSIPALVGSQRLPTATVALHSTAGGRFASTGNPASVVATPWGSLTLRFTACDRATVDYQADDDAFGSGSFTVARLGPPVEGLAWLCDPGDPNVPRPGPAPEGP